SVLLWEPILNETRYPLDFSMKSLQITKDEYPYPYRPVAAADVHSAGVRDNYDVVYGWPGDDEKEDKPEQCIFTREFGEYVDDWYAHNNLNRASRSWGEKPQLTQALSLAKTTEEMYRTTGQFIGGAQWHPFDHQRGYHPDPYWGGIYDAFRQPKYAFYMFAAQTDCSRGVKGNRNDDRFLEFGKEKHPETAKKSLLSVSDSCLISPHPMVYIAHEMTQFSDSDVLVFSNCDSVRLSIYNGKKSWTLPVEQLVDRDPRHLHVGMELISDSEFCKLNAAFHRPVRFKNVWNFWEARELSYTQKNWQGVNMTVEGIIGGKVVCKETCMPSRRSTKLRLRADEMGRQLIADGSDFIVVICEVTDDSGHVRRLAKENIVFMVEGEGEIIGGLEIQANPRAVEWGSAPILIKATRKAGKIKVHAEVQFPGTHAPTSADLEIESIPYEGHFCFDETIALQNAHREMNEGQGRAIDQLTDEQKARLLKEVEEQQADFGIER
ncbi:MAG: glycoside hydrolase family 2, partial [Prevotella sp.]|nr:glycoside hydrolase family 2 [Prevotella sp.]